MLGCKGLIFSFRTLPLVLRPEKNLQEAKIRYVRRFNFAENVLQRSSFVAKLQIICSTIARLFRGRVSLRCSFTSCPLACETGSHYKYFKYKCYNIGVNSTLRTTYTNCGKKRIFSENKRNENHLVEFNKVVCWGGGGKWYIMNRMQQVWNIPVARVGISFN